MDFQKKLKFKSLSKKYNLDTVININSFFGASEDQINSDSYTLDAEEKLGTDVD